MGDRGPDSTAQPTDRLMAFRAVLWDFGGVLADSPFDAFDRYERQQGLPSGFLRSVNAVNPDTNAWACLERSSIDLDTFVERFRTEAEAAGADGRVDGHAVIALLSGRVRPVMIEAVRHCRRRLRTALLTNNTAVQDDTFLGDLFDVVVESSKAGTRKPDPEFYELALTALDVAPADAVFLDDLGVNLKPARQLGMATIKVVNPEEALDELEALVGFPVLNATPAPAPAGRPAPGRAWRGCRWPAIPTPPG